jgi:hypothetical protein
MRRRNGSGKFHPEFAEEGDINPMDGVANLADVMLVFACGLMLALITYWNVDVAATADTAATTPEGVEITEDVGSADGSQEQTPDQGSLVQYGTVYRDPETGKLYIMTEGDG